MSLKLPSISGEEVIHALERAGFQKVSQRGSHVKMRHPQGYSAIVPMHRELRTGTLRSILRQSHLSLEEFLQLLQ